MYNCERKILLFLRPFRTFQLRLLRGLTCQLRGLRPPRAPVFCTLLVWIYHHKEVLQRNILHHRRTFSSSSGSSSSCWLTGSFRMNLMLTDVCLIGWYTWLHLTECWRWNNDTWLERWMLGACRRLQVSTRSGLQLDQSRLIVRFGGLAAGGSQLPNLCCCRS